MTRVRPGLAVGVVVSAGLALWPLVTSAEQFQLQRLEYVLAGLMVAIGLNIVTGYAGQLSLGPGAIFGVGGYTAALVADRLPTHTGLVVMCAAALVASAVVGLVIGIPALRVGGFYLGMTTLFFALLLPVVVSNMTLTKKERGISLLANVDFHQRLHGLGLYEVSLAVVVVLVVGSWALLESRTGHRFVTLAASEELAASLGVAGYRTKLLAFLWSALPAGLGGAFYVYTQQFISPGSVAPTLSIYLLAACVIGGFGTVLGPYVGGLLVIGLSQYLGRFAQYEGVIFGILLVLFSVTLPEGLVGIDVRARRMPTPWRNAPRLPGMPAGREAVAAAAVTVDAGAADPGLVAQLVTPDAARLRISAVRRAFGGVTAVDGVDLVVEPGTVHGLVGSNGSGKTTLLNLVSGFHVPDGGTIALCDERLDGQAPHRVAAAGVARTFQTPKVLERATLLANVVVGAERPVPGGGFASALRTPRGRDADGEVRRRALRCLQALGLADRAGEAAGTQPHGTRRLLELARALAVNPRVVLLDEPAAGLSAAELQVLRSAIAALAAAGVAVLLVEHNVPLVLEVADHVTVLHEGTVLASGTPRQVVTDRHVADAFLGQAAGPGGTP